MARKRKPTTTSNFGVGRRESHDASGFYSRFHPPEISDDTEIAGRVPISDPFVVGDARDMRQLPDNSVALVVTSPPYFAGKQYEEELGRDGVPSSYIEYLELLHDVFRECRRVLEPGGRIAVNIANLGRKPYRSLSADVIRILEDDLGLLLRGEVIWEKGRGASGSCAWGSFRSPTNAVLRDLTERIVIASKARFDRALSVAERRDAGLPWRSTTSSDEFMEATLDRWSIPPESARRVGHPAPFPVELPERLIHLYTYADDLVLDPFMGSGSSLVAAAATGRRFVGYDLDPSYVERARQRVAGVAHRPSHDHLESGDAALRVGDGTVESTRSMLERAAASEMKARDIATWVLSEAGFVDIEPRERRIRGLGLSVDIVARDQAGEEWLFDLSGSFTSQRSGLARSDAMWRSLGRATVMSANGHRPLVLLTSRLPRRGTEGDMALRAAGTATFFDAVEILSADGQTRLAKYATGGHTEVALPGFWNDDDLDGRA